MRAEVLVSGCFNVLHAGHVELLEYASKFGKVTVALNADKYVREKYGDKAVPLVNRAYCLKHNSFVDEVVMFMEANPSRLIYKLRPEFYIRGPDYLGVELPEAEAAHDVGARVLIHHAQKIFNSSSLIHSLEEKNFTELAGVTESSIGLQSPVEPLTDIFTISFGDPDF